MSNILTAHVEIEGVRPLLWRWFGPDALPLEKRERTGVPGNDPEEWRKCYLATSEGQLYLEASYVFACLRDAARHTSRKRGTLQPYITATLQVMESRALIDRHMPEVLTQDPEAPVYLDVRSVRNPTTRGRNVRYRVAASAGWRAAFRILWDRTVVSTGEMQAVLRDAGRLSGIGDGRSIGFGRFEVLRFDVVDGATSA